MSTQASQKNAYDIIADSMAVMNDEMLERANQRQRTRELWQIGKPFNLQEKQGLKLRVAAKEKLSSNLMRQDRMEGICAGYGDREIRRRRIETSRVDSKCRQH